MKSLLPSLVVIAICLSVLAQSPHNPSSPPASTPAENSQPYRDSTFGFRYRIPYGWVDRTQEMQEGSDAGKGEVLLAVFERPPQATGDSINAAVVIAAEKASPELKKAEDYLAPLTELTTAKGFTADGDPAEVEIDSRRMIRADFSKPLNDKLTMHQSTLVWLSKGQIVSFTFIAESVDAADQLIERISFSPAKSRAK